MKGTAFLELGNTSLQSTIPRQTNHRKFGQGVVLSQGWYLEMGVRRKFKEKVITFWKIIIFTIHMQ